MCEKRKNGAKYVCEVLKCIDLTKLQKCNERVSEDEESLERHKVSKTKGPQIRCIPHRRRGLAQCKSNCRSRWFNSLRKKRTLKAQVLSTEAKTLAQYKSSCEEKLVLTKM